MADPSHRQPCACRGPKRCAGWWDGFNEDAHRSGSVIVCDGCGHREYRLDLVRRWSVKKAATHA